MVPNADANATPSANENSSSSADTNSDSTAEVRAEDEPLLDRVVRSIATRAAVEAGADVSTESDGVDRC
ncbi:hypothetical protein ACFQGT_07665 [Natrialbaceae archaeon GCM10025810]|uniref:hypothetical protein n=1 Tax=Halovalidus salilacus TaxID=3075124 RepID=UPI003620566A